ncbi:hypothetical protein G6F61_014409 [Rhizopus arrhizus]|nr:hypothetical protein G6F61_014409 [Rhizopus arrhizus]
MGGAGGRARAAHPGAAPRRHRLRQPVPAGHPARGGAGRGGRAAAHGGRGYGGRPQSGRCAAAALECAATPVGPGAGHVFGG